MAALAGMTVVVEAAERSGSLITADLAADSAATSARCPGPVTSRASAGANELLAGGACLVRDAQDVLDAMLGPGARSGSSATGPRSSAELAPCSAAVERGDETSDAIAADARPRRRRSARPPSRVSSCSATSPARSSASTRRTLLPPSAAVV